MPAQRQRQSRQEATDEDRRTSAASSSTVTSTPTRSKRRKDAELDLEAGVSFPNVSSRVDGVAAHQPAGQLPEGSSSSATSAFPLTWNTLVSDVQQSESGPPNSAIATLPAPSNPPLSSERSEQGSYNPYSAGASTYIQATSPLSWTASQQPAFPSESFPLIDFDFYSGIVGPELSFDINTSGLDDLVPFAPATTETALAHSSSNLRDPTRLHDPSYPYPIYPPVTPAQPSSSTFEDSGQHARPQASFTDFGTGSGSGSGRDQGPGIMLGGPRRMPAILEPQDQPIISHFLERMSDFAKVRDNAVPNHYLSLFSAGLFYPPLYAGILAFSSRHLTYQLPSDSPRRRDLTAYSSEKHTACGRALFQGLSDVNNLDVDVLLPSILIYCQYEISGGSEPSRIQGLLDLTKLLIQRLPVSVTALKPFTQRVAVILTSYDVRASMFGLGSAAYTQQLGEPLFHDDAEADLNPGSRSWGASADLLYINYLTSCCIRVDRDLRQARAAAATDQVLDGIARGQKLYRRIVNLQDTFDPPSLDRLSSSPAVLQGADPIDHSPEALSKAFLAGLYNSLIVYLCRVLQVPVPPRPVNRIINSAMNISQAVPNVTQSIFPRPLFFAALELHDPNQFDWILARLAQSAAAGWGAEVERKRELLIHIRAAEASGTKQDLGKLMLSSGKHFIL